MTSSRASTGKSRLAPAEMPRISAGPYRCRPRKPSGQRECSRHGRLRGCRRNPKSRHRPRHRTARGNQFAGSCVPCPSGRSRRGEDNEEKGDEVLHAPPYGSASSKVSRCRQPRLDGHGDGNEQKAQGTHWVPSTGVENTSRWSTHRTVRGKEGRWAPSGPVHSMMPAAPRGARPRTPLGQSPRIALSRRRPGQRLLSEQPARHSERQPGEQKHRLPVHH